MARTPSFSNREVVHIPHIKLLFHSSDLLTGCCIFIFLFFYASSIRVRKANKIKLRIMVMLALLFEGGKAAWGEACEACSQDEEEKSSLCLCRVGKWVGGLGMVVSRTKPRSAAALVFCSSFC